jgi:hypothetical protein
MSDICAWAMAAAVSVTSAVGWVAIVRAIWRTDVNAPVDTPADAFRAIIADTWRVAPPGSGDENRWFGTAERDGVTARWVVTARFEEAPR